MRELFKGESFHASFAMQCLLSSLSQRPLELFSNLFAAAAVEGNKRLTCNYVDLVPLFGYEILKAPNWEMVLDNAGISTAVTSFMMNRCWRSSETLNHGKARKEARHYHSAMQFDGHTNKNT